MSIRITGLGTSGCISQTSSKTGELLAITALIVYVVSIITIQYSTFLETYPELAAYSPYGLCNGFSLALAATSIALRPRALSRMQMILIAISMAVFLLSANRTGDYRFAYTCILLIAIAGIDLVRISQTYYRAVIATILVLMVLSILGALNNRDVIPNGRLVYAYGFMHPNALGALLFSSLAAMTYACWRKKTWPIPAALATIAAVFCYCFLSSHASAAILGLLAFCVLIGHISSLNKRICISRALFVSVLVVVPITLLAFMLACAVFYDSTNPVLQTLNKLTHGRMYFSHEYYVSHEGFTLMGRKNDGVDHFHSGLPFASVDSGYCFVPLVNGLLTLFAITATYVIAVLKLSRKNLRFATMSIILIAAMYLIVESYALFPASCFAVLFLADSFAATHRNDGNALEERLE